MQNNFNTNPNYKPNYIEFSGCMYLTKIPSDLEKFIKVRDLILLLLMVHDNIYNAIPMDGPC